MKTAGNEEAPSAGTLRASGNEFNDQEENVMSNSSTAVSNVIPFKFEEREVRTLLLNDQPLFCAADVCEVLGYANSRQAIQKNCRSEGVSVRDTLTRGGKQALTFIAEGNLYRLIIKSRKEEAQRFEAWVCDEVLPAIRKHGRYEDSSNKMTTLVNDVIGVSGTNLINGVIGQKITILPVGVQRQAKHKLHSILHTRFNVPRTELIPAEKLDVACEYLAAYALEGEWLSKESKHQPNLSYPIATLVERRASMLTVRNNTQAWLDVTLHDLRDIRGSETPCEKLLGELSKAGYDIEGCWWELRTYRNKVRELASFAIGLNRAIEDPHRYAVSPTS